MIKLRKIEPTDLPFLYQWENDASAWADGANHNPLSQQDLRAYIESTTGCIDLFDFDPRNRRAAIGMYIAPEHRGKGVGKEALRLLEQYAFGHLNLRVLYAVIATNNTACTTLYRNAGYTGSSPLSHWTLEDDAVIWIKNHQ